MSRTQAFWLIMSSVPECYLFTSAPDFGIVGRLVILVWALLFAWCMASMIAPKTKEKPDDR